MHSEATAAWSSRPRAWFSRPRAIVAVIRRDFQIRRSYHVAFALDLALGALQLLIYYFISRTFVDVTTADLGAAPSYFAFALVGITLSVVITSATSEVASGLRQEQLTGTLEVLTMQPVSPTQMVLGFAALPFVLAIARVGIYLVLGALVLDVDLGDASWPGFAAVLLATGPAVASLGVAACAIVLVVKRGDVLVGLATFAMAFFGGAFFPISVLPGWIEVFASVIPTRYAFEGAREALFSGSGWTNDVVFLLVFAAVTLPIALVLFRQALGFARRMGSLGQY